MRVAFVISTLDRCGPVNVLYEIIRNLTDDVQARVFTLAKEPPTSRAADFAEMGCDVVCACASRVESMLVGDGLLARALQRFDPDIIHAHGFRAYLCCQDLKYPKIATIHNCVYEDFSRSYGGLRARWMEKKELAALKKFDKIVACSEANAEHLRSKYALKCIAIRNGVNQDEFHPIDMSNRMKLRNMLGIKQDKTIVISTGGCSERKGTLPFVHGFSAVLDKTNTNAELHIFGDGPLYQKCIEMKLPKVVFHGFESNVTPWLQLADLFVSASQSEGMPLAVLEALSCGCPALLSDIAPHCEIANAVGNQGCVRIFNAADAEKCADGLADVLASPLERPCDMSCFGGAVMAKDYASAFRMLCR